MKKAFTIVELLVVIVVIGILAAITIVSYTGISSKAVVSAIQSELSNAKKQINLYYVDHGVYPKSVVGNCPRDISDIPDTKYCIKKSVGDDYVYIPNSPVTPTSYIITTKLNDISYKVTDTTAPAQGDSSSFGLVGHWALDNVTGITDLSGNGNNGTAYGAMNIGTATNHLGIANNATSFDGVNDYVDVGNNAILNISNNFTISAWIKNPLTSVNPAGSIVSWGQTVAGKRRSLFIWNGGSGTSMYLYFSGAYSLANLNSGFTVNDNVWHHILATVSVSNVVSIYVDGDPKVTSSLILNSYTYSGTKLGSNDFNEYYSGLIENVRLYNRTLSVTEITALYNSN